MDRSIELLEHADPFLARYILEYRWDANTVGITSQLRRLERPLATKIDELRRTGEQVPYGQEIIIGTARVPILDKGSSQKHLDILIKVYNDRNHPYVAFYDPRDDYKYVGVNAHLASSADIIDSIVHELTHAVDPGMQLIALL